MSRPKSNLRLFVAAYPPPAIAEALAQRLESLTLPPGTRRTPADQIHLTLQFIGDTPAAEMDATCESVRRAAAGIAPFDLTLERLIALPERGPSRLLAAQTSAPASLLELHSRLAQRFARKVRGKPSDRFRPHLTLCRFASPQRRMTIDHPKLDGTFAVEQIRLMRSTLSHEGAAHHEVVAVTLSA